MKINIYFHVIAAVALAAALSACQEMEGRSPTEGNGISGAGPRSYVGATASAAENGQTLLQRWALDEMSGKVKLPPSLYSLEISSGKQLMEKPLALVSDNGYLTMIQTDSLKARCFYAGDGIVGVYNEDVILFLNTGNNSLEELPPLRLNTPEGSSKKNTIINVAYDINKQKMVVIYAPQTLPDMRDPGWSGDREPVRMFVVNPATGEAEKQLITDLNPSTDHNHNLRPGLESVLKYPDLFFYAGGVYNQQWGAFYNLETEKSVSLGKGAVAFDEESEAPLFVWLRMPSGVGGSLQMEAVLLDITGCRQGSVMLPIDMDYTFVWENAAWQMDYAAKNDILLENYKWRYNLHFEDGMAEAVRVYTEDRLDELLSVSRDGRYQVYRADQGGGGDSAWADILVKDTQTGELRYLAEDSFGSVSFGSGTQLLVSHFDSVALIDAETGEALEQDFGLDCKAEDAVVVGLAYDSAKQWYLLGWVTPVSRDSFENPLKAPLCIRVVNQDGELVKDIVTNWEIQPRHIYDYQQVSLLTDGEGGLQINRQEWDSEAGSVYYW